MSQIPKVQILIEGIEIGVINIPRMSGEELEAFRILWDKQFVGKTTVGNVEIFEEAKP